MTPFGLKLRQLRLQSAISQKDMAAQLGVSAAYICALERGHKGAPSFAFVQRVIAVFNIIWDEADELMQLAKTSHPKVMIDTRCLSVQATCFVKNLADEIPHLDVQSVEMLATLLADLRQNNQNFPS